MSIVTLTGVAVVSHVGRPLQTDIARPAADRRRPDAGRRPAQPPRWADRMPAHADGRPRR